MAARKSMIVLATGVAGLFAALGSEALAHVEKDPGKVTIGWDGAGFTGKVKSKNPSCVDQRKVRLFRRGRGPALGSAISDDEGGWRVGAKRKHGDYYAVVPRLALKMNGKHKHLCKPAKSRRSKDAFLRNCDEAKLFDGSGSAGDGSQGIDVDDDLTVDVEGDRRYTDLDDFAGSYPPISLGPVGFGESIHIVGYNGRFGGPVQLDPIYVFCSSPGGSGVAVLDATGVAPGGDSPVGVFYNETYTMPVISFSR